MRTAYAQELALPFVLLEQPGTAREEPPSSVVLAKLDVLQGLMEETRSRVSELSRLNLEVIRQVSTASPKVDPMGVAPPDVPTEALRIRVLGSFDVRYGDRTIARWKSRKARQLFAFLASQPERWISRETLVEMFWPDSPAKRGANNLSIAVHQVRSQLGELLGDDVASRRCGITVQQGVYRLDANCAVDVVEFEEHLAQARTALAGRGADGARVHLVDAIRLYRGELLESDLLEEWTVEPRRELAERYRLALVWLAHDAEVHEDWSSVLDFANRLVSQDACDEEGCRSLIRAHVALGNRSQALRAFRACERHLAAELGVGPAEETRVLVTELLGKSPLDGAASGPTPS